MGNILDTATEIYVFVDDFLKDHPRIAHWRASNNNQPAFTDAEVITLGLMQSALKLATLKDAYEMVRDNIGFAFPALVSYKRFIKRLHELTATVGFLLRAAFTRSVADLVRLYIVDSKPIPVCKPLRHGRVRLLTEDGAYFGKTSAGWFFGFKLHVLIHHSGAILSALLTPGNWQDGAPGVVLGMSTGGGVVIGDYGYRGQATFSGFDEQAGLVRVMPQDDGPGHTLVSQVRQRVETVLSGLWSQFIDRVYSRSWNGLWNTIKLKLCYFNMKLAGIVS